jgi:hypothetical protein
MRFAGGRCHDVGALQQDATSVEPHLRNPGRNGANLQRRGLCSDVSAIHRSEVRVVRRHEVVIGRFIIAAAILLSCSTGFAQVAAPSMSNAVGSPGAGAMGDTAAPPPPGANAAAAALDGAGVPLGATDLFVGGLSPSPNDLGGSCPSPASVGPLGTGSIFSGDGTLSTSGSDLGGTAAANAGGCSVAPTAGVGPLGQSSAAGDATAFGGGNIPLATTALPTTGLGGPIVTPGSITPCSSTGASAFAMSPIPSPLSALAPAPRPLIGQMC